MSCDAFELTTAVVRELAASSNLSSGPRSRSSGPPSVSSSRLPKFPPPRRLAGSGASNITLIAPARAGKLSVSASRLRASASAPAMREKQLRPPSYGTWYVGAEQAKATGGVCNCAATFRLLREQGPATPGLEALMHQVGEHLSGCPLCGSEDLRAATRTKYDRHHGPELRSLHKTAKERREHPRVPAPDSGIRTSAGKMAARKPGACKFGTPSDTKSRGPLPSKIGMGSWTML